MLHAQQSNSSIVIGAVVGVLLGQIIIVTALSVAVIIATTST